MAAGATHAALTQHFATAGSNAADISAKVSCMCLSTSHVVCAEGVAVPACLILSMYVRICLHRASLAEHHEQPACGGTITVDSSS
jgi:hypothetical protein